MMRQCRLVILILLLGILMCDAAKEFECKNKITALKHMTNPTPQVQKLSSQQGRFITTHNPVTCDGYVLTIFRLTFGDNKPPPTRSPVLLVHGMFQSSDRFLRQSADKSLAYKLQDLGYDVWLFNARGNKYCRKNVKIESECDEKIKFFDYGFEEIGLLDLAATVDYIISVTQYQKIQFIGHSLGGAYFLVLNSLRPDYNDLFDRAFLLAPMAYLRMFRHAPLQYELVNVFRPQELLSKGVVEIYPYKCIKSEDYKFAPEDCLGEEKYQKICRYLDLEKVMFLQNDRNTKFDTRGGSVRQLTHFAQLITSGVFRRYQFPNNNDNLKNYGEAIPPEYDLSQITVPTTIFYSTTDEYVNHADIKNLAGKMQNATTVKVAKMNFTHDDFVNSSDAMFYVYTAIIRALPENPGPKRPNIPTSEPQGIFGNNKLIIWGLIAIVGIALCICLCVSITNWVSE